MIYSLNKNKKIIKKLLKTLKNYKLNMGEYKELLERTHSFLLTNSSESDDYNLSLSVICHVANKLPEDVFIQQLMYDCIVQSRVFLYKDMVRTSFFDNIQIPSYDYISKEYYTLEKSLTTLTKDQKKLFDIFQEQKRLIVSAPTSFGKSRIIQEIIIHNEYKNILIVLPTIALLNETFTRFKDNKILSNRKYSIYNSLGTKDLEFNKENNIFILTPEKTGLLLDKHPYLIFDFFTMDEIYKIQGEDDRSKVFTDCLYRLSKIRNIHFYLIGPYFSGFSPRFIEYSKSRFEPFSSEIVQKDDYDIDSIPVNESYTINGQRIKKLTDIKRNLRNIFKVLDEQTLIYRGKQKYYAELTAKYLIDYKKREVSSELIDYISENISNRWTLVSCLKAGIAFHHGALPKYIQTEIIDSFNNGELDVIVCTSTITEGVNTTAKNVIIYDNFKGETELSGFDIKNIKGRAGRFLHHFIGNIYSLIPIKDEEDKGIIEFSYFDNNDLDAEDTIQVDKNDLRDKNLEKRKNIEKLLKKQNIPLEIIQANKFISIHKQIDLIRYLRSHLLVIEEITFSGNLPKKEQLEEILMLCHKYLFTIEHQEDRNYTILQLIRLTKHYVYNKPPIKDLINEFESDNIDTRIRNAFNLIATYFEFALPKYLSAFENLFNFVCRERKQAEISLALLITVLEFGHSAEHEISLKEAGLPNDIIKKVTEAFKDCNSLEQIRDKYRIDPFLIDNLSPFEKKIFKRYI